MKGPVPVESASALIDEKIKELGDWRGKTLAKVRELIHEADPEIVRPFLVCIHDATPAYTRETRVMIRDLAPLIGRRLSFGVVPDWDGQWPLAAHPDYCRLVRESSEELLLHGYFHRRQRGWGPTTLFVGSCDEMNGLDAEET